MFNFVSRIAFVLVIAIVMLLVSNPAAKAQDEKHAKDAVIVVYASWSVVCRDLRPVAQQVSQALKFNYIEYDIDDNNTQTKLAKMDLNTPEETPYVIVVKSGKVVFKKAYPNATPDMLREQLTDELSKYI